MSKDVYVRHEIPFQKTRCSGGRLVEIDHVVRYSLPSCTVTEPKHYWLLPDILAVVLGEQTIYIHLKEKTEVAGHAPEGWKLVPVEPTREMLDAYIAQAGRFSSARSDWAAMLAAVPLSAQDARSVRDMTAMVDAAMVEMKNISPPMRRSECEQLIKAAIGNSMHMPLVDQTAEPAGKGE